MESGSRAWLGISAASAAMLVAIVSGSLGDVVTKAMTSGLDLGRLASVAQAQALDEGSAEVLVSPVAPDSGLSGTAGGASSDLPFSPMSPEGIRALLELQGYSNITDLRLREDVGVYEAQAERYGEPVYLRVDAQSGKMLGPEAEEPVPFNPMSAQGVRALLETQGYSNVTDLVLRAEERVYEARAERDGEPVQLRVDATSGEVLPPDRLSEDQVRSKLEAEGYAALTGFQRGEETDIVFAEKDGERRRLEIDPWTGAVVRESAE